MLAGRNPPAPAWRTDVDWADLTRIVPLRNLRPEESQTYLATRGIPDEQHAAALAFTHGHPLALALVAEVLAQGGNRTAGLPEHAPDVVRVLLERFVRDVPSPRHRLALEVCAHARVTTEGMLAAALEATTRTRSSRGCGDSPSSSRGHTGSSRTIWRARCWRPTCAGGIPRDTGIAPAGPPANGAPASAGGWARAAARGLDILYLHRGNPDHGRCLRLGCARHRLRRAGVSGGSPGDAGDGSPPRGRYLGGIARHWAERQPGAFTAFRGVGGDVFGFAAVLALQDATPEDLAADPAALAAWTFARRHGPIRAARGRSIIRFWMGRDTYQAVSSAQNLMAANCLLHWVTTPRLAWSFVSVADPDFWHPVFTHSAFTGRPRRSSRWAGGTTGSIPTTGGSSLRSSGWNHGGARDRERPSAGIARAAPPHRR